MAKSGSESPKKNKKKRDDPVSVTSSGSMGEVFESIASVQQSLAHLLSKVIPELSDARAQQQKTNQQLTDGLNALKSLVSNLPSGSTSTTTTTTDSTVTNSNHGLWETRSNSGHSAEWGGDSVHRPFPLTRLTIFQS